jgi:FkbM family methyltransferase
LRAYDLGAARQRASARLKPADDGVQILSDSPARGWQIVDFVDRDVTRATIRVRLLLRPVANGTADFCLHSKGGVILLRVGQDGTLRRSDEAGPKECSIEKDASGWLRLDALYFNQDPRIILGLATKTGDYRGTNAPQFELKDLEAEIVEPRWTPTPEDPLRIVQLGLPTLGDPAWQYFAAGLRITAFSPDAAEVARLQAQLPADGGHQVIGKALSDRNGTSPFHVTKDKAQSSIFKPDAQRLKPYAAADGFTPASEAKIETCRFDTLVRAGSASVPDAIRVRAPGFEYNALRGFGNVLDEVLAVEVPFHFYPLYRKQKLVGDIIDLLDSSGLELRRVTPPAAAVQQAFGQEMVQATGVFLRKPPKGPALGRFQLLEEIWGLPYAS